MENLPPTAPTEQRSLTLAEKLDELAVCSKSPIYFLREYGWIQGDGKNAPWIRFKLWSAQTAFLNTLQFSRLIVALKARQLGFTWLVLGFVLWLMLFRRAAIVLMFSRAEEEAKALIEQRLSEMYRRLPEWMQAGKLLKDNTQKLFLANGSRATSFPTTGGRSYTATFVLVDEADYIPDLDHLLAAVKPTIDSGGQLVLLSTSDKDVPESAFKKIYRAAKAGENDYVPVFHPWNSRPDRDEAWYQDKVRNIRTTDLLYQEYPATDAQALAANILDKRFHPDWIGQCYSPAKPITDRFILGPKAPAIVGLDIYRVPVPEERFILGGDSASDNPTSDDSALAVLNKATGEEYASMAKIMEPTEFAGAIKTVALWFNRAELMIESNNHGGQVLSWLRDNAPELKRLCGPDGKPGWNTSTKTKIKLYDDAAEAFVNGDTILHNWTTMDQLLSIEGRTTGKGILSAPEGLRDDRAMSYVLALQGILVSLRAGKTRPPQVVGRGIGR